MTRSSPWTRLAPDNDADQDRAALQRLGKEMAAGSSGSYAYPTLETLLHHYYSPTATTGEPEIMKKLGYEDPAYLHAVETKIQEAAQRLGFTDEFLERLSQRLEQSSARTHNA